MLLHYHVTQLQILGLRHLLLRRGSTPLRQRDWHSRGIVACQLRSQTADRKATYIRRGHTLQQDPTICQLLLVKPSHERT